MTELITCRLLNWCWVYSVCLTPGLAAWPHCWPASPLTAATWMPVPRPFLCSPFSYSAFPGTKMSHPHRISLVATAETFLSLLPPRFPFPDHTAAKQGHPKNTEPLKCKSSRERLQMRGAATLRERLQCSSEAVSANPLWSPLIVPLIGLEGSQGVQVWDNWYIEN